MLPPAGAGAVAIAFAFFQRTPAPPCTSIDRFAPSLALLPLPSLVPSTIKAFATIIFQKQKMHDKGNPDDRPATNASKRATRQFSLFA
jgi:hypothetical protein